MTSRKQRAAARKNIRKAARVAKRKQTLKHLPKKHGRRLADRPRKSDNHEVKEHQIRPHTDEALQPSRALAFPCELLIR
jgi:hypothetical protein